MNNLDIKNLRTILGLTQSQLAEKVGVSVNTIQNWERGGTIPKSKHPILSALIPNQHIVFGGMHVQGGGDAINGDKVIEEIKTQQDVEEIKTTVGCDARRLLALLEAKQRSVESLIEQQGRFLTIIENLSNQIKHD